MPNDDVSLLLRMIISVAIKTKMTPKEFAEAIFDTSRHAEYLAEVTKCGLDSMIKKAKTKK